MLTKPNYSYIKNDVDGFVPEVWFDNQYNSATHYLNDKLMANLFHTTPKLYSDFMKYYGALGPRNWQTYFLNEEDCITFLDILSYIWIQINENGRTWLSLTWELINYIESVSSGSALNEVRSNYYLSKIKTYVNEQSYQGIYKDINTTKLDSKDLNTGNFTENPFKPNRSKKPTHYTIG